MHRAEQIVQAAATAIAAQSGIAANVRTHDSMTANAEDQELPAVSVNQGDDSPTDDDGFGNLAFIDSLSQLKLVLKAQGSTQQEIAAELARLRAVTHRAMLAAPRTLGLDFVMGIQYGGASEPEYTTEGSPLAGRMECAFAVLYRMNLTDPE
jgi:hypothetical protein